MARNRTETKQGGNKVAGLTQDQINALLAGTRQKGLYNERLASFMESLEGGIDVKATWPDFAGKKAQSLKTGFESAKKHKDAPEDAKNVRVITNEENVFLINGNVVQVAEAA